MIRFLISIINSMNDFFFQLCSELRDIKIINLQFKMIFKILLSLSFIGFCYCGVSATPPGSNKSNREGFCIYRHRYYPVGIERPGPNCEGITCGSSYSMLFVT